MKKIFLSSAMLIVSSVAATAADLPAKAPLYKAPVAVVYDWTGFYLGGYYGHAIGQSRVRTPVGPFDTDGVVDISKDGWSAGATVGANWQFNPNWLIGIEADIGYLANDRVFSEWNDNSVTVGVKTSGYGTVRGRLGYVTGPSLLYATGGAAFTRVQDLFGSCAGAACTGGATPTSVSSLKTGWTAGAGIETMLSRNWSQKTEYLYVDAGSSNFLSVPYATPHPASFRNEFHIIKTGINYRFGGPAEPLPFFSGVLLPTNHNWAGFYAGVNAGGGLATSPARGGIVVATVFGDNDMRGGGFAGGAQAGYNFMNLFGRQSWFAGVEGDIGYLGIKASHKDWNDNFAISQKTNWYGTLRGRVGTTTGPALLYVTGGAAFVQVENGISVTLSPAVLAQGGLAVANDVRSETRAGWTFGGGTEVALDANWSAKLDYLYIDAGKSLRTAVATGVGGSLSIASDFSNRFHVIRAGLNYSFNAPLVAKY